MAAKVQRRQTPTSSRRKQKQPTYTTLAYDTESLPSRTTSINPEVECALLDTLESGFAIPNDAQLASWLGVEKELLYMVRAGERRIGLMPRLRILDHIAFLKARSLVESILPENLATELRQFNQSIVARQIRKRMPDEPAHQLVDLAKSAFKFDTDAELAEFLSVQRPTISVVRAGKSELGPKPRLRIVERLTGLFETERLLTLAETSSLLAQAVQQYCRQGEAPESTLSVDGH